MKHARNGVNELAAIGLFSALALAGGYLFIAVPNVEVFTALVFLSGLFLGSKNGMLVGLVAQTLFGLLNPFGPSPLPLLAAQVLNRMLVGLVGGAFRPLLREQALTWSRAALLGLTGLVLTWLYDLMTDFSFFVVAGFSVEKMQTTLVLGLPFYLVHGAVNTAIFALVLPVFVAAARRSGLVHALGLK